MATFDVVFEGGGAKGVALAGGVAALHKNGHSLGRLIGTSAGAITATNLAVGYTPEEIFGGALERTPDGKSVYSTFADVPKLSDDELKATGIFKVLSGIPLPMTSRAEERLDLMLMHVLAHAPHFASLLSLFELGGLFRGDGFLTWMKGCLAKKGVENATLGELHKKTGKDLSVVATDTTDRRLLVFNHRTTPDLPVVWAVRMSMSIPFYWQEVRWDGQWGKYLGRDMTGRTIVDGGVVSNFPLFLLTDSSDDEVVRLMGAQQGAGNPAIGFYLDPTLDVPGEVTKPTIDHTSPTRARIDALLDTLMSARDNATFDAHRERVVKLPVRGYGTTDFDMPEARAKALFDAAHAATQAWLTRAPV